MKTRKIRFMNKNKKAWLRIVEAFIAILLILATLLILLNRQTTDNSLDNEITLLQDRIIVTISKDDNFRNQILSNDSSGVEAYLDNVLPYWLNSSVSICNPLEVCPINVSSDIILNKNIYSSSALVVSNLTTYSERQLKLFFWRI